MKLRSKKQEKSYQRLLEKRRFNRRMRHLEETILRGATVSTSGVEPSINIEPTAAPMRLKVKCV